MFSIRKSFHEDVKRYYAPSELVYSWYVTINPYIPYIWGVLMGFLKVMEGMCPIYGYPGVI